MMKVGPKRILSIKDKKNNQTSFDSPQINANLSYDPLNRLKNIDFPPLNTGISYTYDKNGNRKEMYTEEGKTSYIYNSLNQLTEITNPYNEKTKYEYYPNGLLKSKTLPNGIKEEYTYDSSGRLTKITHSPLPEITYTYDKVGNRLTMIIGTQTTQYQYDNLYRLTKVIYPNSSSQAYTYDPVGNRLTMNTITYTYNKADQLLQVGTTTYSYDNNGNLIQKNNTSYAYDYENRLTQITYPDKSTETFTYCPLGKRIAKDNSIFLYDDQDLIAEYDPEGTLNARYTFGSGIDNPISVRIGTQSYFYHLDGLGSVIAITDSNKNIVSSYSYDAFGFPLPSSIFNLPSSLLFTSREYEPKSNLYYYRARYYDPSVGRFLSTDPILRPKSCPTCPGANTFPIKGAGLLGYPGIINLMLQNPQKLHFYVYVENNPVNFTDPSGKWIPPGLPWLWGTIGIYFGIKLNEICESLSSGQTVYIGLNPPSSGVIGGTGIYLKVHKNCDPPFFCDYNFEFFGEFPGGI